jgi:3-methylcrotonyl-CoA carboxylase alpha subunit
MIAKLIVHKATREEALAGLADALQATRVAGPHSNLAFLEALCRAPDFIAGAFDTGFIDRNLETLGAVPAATDRIAAATALHALLDPPSALASSPWDMRDGFQLSGTRLLSWPVMLNGEADTIRVAWDGQGLLVDGFDPEANVALVRDGASFYALHKGRQTVLGPREPGAAGHEGGDGDGAIKAPMHGKIVAIDVKPGQTVTRGTRVAIVEAMKMEHALVAKRDGVVGDIALKPGDQVAEGGVILTIGDPD